MKCSGISLKGRLGPNWRCGPVLEPPGGPLALVVAPLSASLGCPRVPSVSPIPAVGAKQAQICLKGTEPPGGAENPPRQPTGIQVCPKAVPRGPKAVSISRKTRPSRQKMQLSMPFPMLFPMSFPEPFIVPFTMPFPLLFPMPFPLICPMQFPVPFPMPISMPLPLQFLMSFHALFPVLCPVPFSN